ncbi:ATP-binding protein [Salinisphaera sp. T31B1]|uniref:ATP-binding protein n=1 Tax=Salinisphaera sp. T31B1 TaxID=727963 RepID=UPI003340CF51
MDKRLRLRQRLMISVSLLAAGVLLAAGWMIVANAHEAIADEMHSSVTLASDIVEASLADGEASLVAARRLERIGHLRHLCLSLVSPGSSAPACPSKPALRAPAWFAALTRPASLPERRIEVAHDLQIRILADPDDEIDETWHDTRGLLALLLIFYLAIVAIAYVLMGRAMVPVRRIDAALQQIEHGDYETRLPAFSLPEFDGIARQFNHMAATLADARRENHRLRDHSLRIQEDERRNLARELHDELGQSLTAIRADAAGILARGDRLPAGVAESAEAIAEVAAHIYDQARQMMRRLRPPGLDELGLMAALEDHIARWHRSRPDIHIEFECQGNDDDLAPTVAIHVFRLIQEALTNALRHAQARQITVRLHTDDVRVEAEIRDDGRGFDTTARHRGLGLSGMAERIALMNGRFELISRPGRGTCVLARIPRDNRPA